MTGEAGGGGLTALGPEDLRFAEQITKQLYDFELDRKDKILASMSVVTAPITILIAGVAFLANELGAVPGRLDGRFDVAELAELVFSLLLLATIGRAFRGFRRLTSAETYSYLPDANTLLQDFYENAEYYGTLDHVPDGAVADSMRAALIELYAESATRNREANELRLGFRQQVFRNTAYALAFAGLALAAVAVHREIPHIWDVATMWRRDVGPAQTH